MEEKEIITAKITELANRHETIKSEMLKILDANKILNEQYDTLETEMYSIEEQYVGLMSKLVE
jgi:predicted nuclease with TOPRIM domain